MSKDEIDYSNTIFYKIYCTDTAVKDLYVGHTTNFVKRKYCHKRSCNNDKDTNHNLKVYKCIRAQGGWKNWKMDIIGFHNCQNHYQARTIEQQYFESLNANLNSISPLPKPKTCIVSIGSKLFDIYLLSDKLNDLGWNLNVLQNPSCFHICITNCHNRTVLEKFIQERHFHYSVIMK